MTPLEERNLVWNLAELIILKHGLKIDYQHLNPNVESDLCEFGNYISGHPMSFEGDFEQCVIEIERKLPSDYKITQANLLGTGEGLVHLMKVV